MPGTIINHPGATGMVRHPSTLDINHPASSGATNHPSGFSGNFASLVASVPVLYYWDARLGITLSGSNVSGMADQTVNGVNATQASGPAQPLYTSIGGTPYLQFTGGAHAMSAPFSHVAPGTTPYWTMTVFRIDTWSGGSVNDVPWADNSGASVTLMSGASPNIASNNGATLNNSAAVGTWFRGAQFVDNTASSYWQVGATKVSGLLGNVAQTTPVWLGWTTAGRRAAWSFFMRIVTNGEPSPAERAAIDAQLILIPGLSVNV